MYIVYLIISYDIVIYKKYVLATYIWFSPKVPGSQPPSLWNFLSYNSNILL